MAHRGQAPGQTSASAISNPSSSDAPALARLRFPRRSCSAAWRRPLRPAAAAAAQQPRRGAGRRQRDLSRAAREQRRLHPAGRRGLGGEVPGAGRRPGGAAARSIGACLFQNTALYPLHLAFLRSFAELAHIDWDSYLALTTKRASRVLVGGRAAADPRRPSTRAPAAGAWWPPSSTPIPAEALGVDQLVEIHGRLGGCAPFARDLLVLVGADPRQVASFAAQAPALRARGIEVADPETLRPGGGRRGLQPGRGRTASCAWCRGASARRSTAPATSW